MRSPAKKIAARLTVATLSGALALTSWAGTAEAANPVTCGATLKSSVTMTADVSCPAGNGVTLYRGVTLNLGGHKLVGPGTGSGTGVTLSYKGGSTVTNGIIRGWRSGVSQDSSDATETVSTARLTNVTLDHAPADFNSGSMVAISGSKFLYSPVWDGMSNLSVTGSTFTASDVNAWGSFATISTSTFLRSAVSTTYYGSLSVDRSTMDGTGYANGPGYCSETSLTITNSTVKNYRKPVNGWWCYVQLAGDTFSNNPGGALSDTSSGFSDFISARVSNNKFTTSGIAVQVGAAVISGNTFDRNTTGLIPNQPADTTVVGNTFSNQTSSGVKAAGNGLILKNNKAVYNGRYGIYAPRAVNQGGNVAYGNGVANCVGLVCATS